jgi:1,3-beta-glucan synthase
MFGEASSFGCDFLFGHVLLAVLSQLLFVPAIDKWHSVMMFWWSPKCHRRTEDRISRRLSRRARGRARLHAVRNVCVFFFIITATVGFVVTPLLIPNHLQQKIVSYVDGLRPGIVYK